MRISGQFYYTKNYKKTDFTNRCYHIRGVNDEKMTRPESLNLNSRGGDINYTKTVIIKIKQNCCNVSAQNSGGYI